MRGFLKETLVGLALAALYLALRAFGLPWPSVTAFFGLLAGLYHANLIGERLFPDAGRLTRLLLGGTLFCALVACIQTAWFYASWPVDMAADVWAVVLASVLSHVICYHPAASDPEHEQDPEAWTAGRVIWGGILLLLSGAAAGYVLLGANAAATTEAIRTPWPLLPHGTLPAIGLLAACALLSAKLVRSRGMSAIHAALGMASITAIAPLVYRLGFGFDGFLHLTGEKVLAATGTLLPHPSYYIGQYVFTTWLARLIDLPDALAAIDRWLVPAAAALLIPLALSMSRRRSPSSALLACLFLPLAAFVATTPQSFAYVLGLAAILLARKSGRSALILGAWSAAVHPLAGIPFLLLAFGVRLASLPGKDLRIPRYLLAALTAPAAALSIPFAFAYLGGKGGTHIDWDISKLWTPGPWLDAVHGLAPWIGTTYTLWPGWASLVIQALPALLLAIIILHLARDLRHGKKPRADTLVLAGAALCLFIAAAGLKTAGDFAFLIDYERGNYADRLGLIATFCLWAAAIPAIRDLFDGFDAQAPLVQGLGLWLVCAFAAALAYDALPRHDALIVGHGWSVGAADIEAVKSIDHDAGDKPYTVLADQSVSAAAVSTLGFKRYAGDVFFYPIPTGGPLYALYLDLAAANHVQDDVLDAAGLGKSKLVYAVINDYWWQADQVNETLASQSDAHWRLSTVTVYKFDLAKASTRDAAKSGK